MPPWTIRRGLLGWFAEHHTTIRAGADMHLGALRADMHLDMHLGAHWPRCMRAVRGRGSSSTTMGRGSSSTTMRAGTRSTTMSMWTWSGAVTDASTDAASRSRGMPATPLHRMCRHPLCRGGPRPRPGEGVRTRGLHRRCLLSSSACAVWTATARRWRAHAQDAPTTAHGASATTCHVPCGMASGRCRCCGKPS
jgi:hypothetical protein